MPIRLSAIPIVLLAGLSLNPSEALAQGMLVASVGRVSGGDVNTPSSTYAISVGGMGARAIGSELEFSQSPRFFDETWPEGRGKVLTLMANIMVVIPIGAFRPYGVAGYGFIRQRTETSVGGVFEDLSSKDVGYNVGGGVVLRVANYLGIRGDLRRFKVHRADGLSFNRATVGLVLGG